MTVRIPLSLGYWQPLTTTADAELSAKLGEERRMELDSKSDTVALPQYLQDMLADSKWTVS